MIASEARSEIPATQRLCIGWSKTTTRHGHPPVEPTDAFKRRHDPDRVGRHSPPSEQQDWRHPITLLVAAPRLIERAGTLRDNQPTMVKALEPAARDRDRPKIACFGHVQRGYSESNPPRAKGTTLRRHRDAHTRHRTASGVHRTSQGESVESCRSRARDAKHHDQTAKAPRNHRYLHTISRHGLNFTPSTVNSP